MNTQLIELADAYATLTADPAAIAKARQALLDAIEAQTRQIEQWKVDFNEMKLERDTARAELEAIRVKMVPLEKDADFVMKWTWFSDTEGSWDVVKEPSMANRPEGTTLHLYAAPVASPDVGALVEADAIEAIDQVMEQAQVFASAWSLVGGVFDQGNAMEDADEAKAELRIMVASMARAALTQSQAARVPDAMAKDAARYQKLRDTDLAKLYCDWVDELLSSPETTSPEDFDAAIDAAPGKGGV